MTSLPCHVRVWGSAFGVRVLGGLGSSVRSWSAAPRGDAHRTANDRRIYSLGVGAAGAESARWRRSRAYAAVTSTP
jgi:hypothetical protein